MNLDIERTTYAIMAHGHDFIMRGLNAGKLSRESPEALFEEKLKEEEKRVQSSENTEGKTAEDYQQSGSHVNIMIRHYSNLPQRKRLDTRA
jgi:hypothetical protein